MLLIIHFYYTALFSLFIDNFQKYVIFYQFLHFCPQNSQNWEKKRKKNAFYAKIKLILADYYQKINFQDRAKIVPL